MTGVGITELDTVKVKQLFVFHSWGVSVIKYSSCYVTLYLAARTERAGEPSRCRSAAVAPQVRAKGPKINLEHGQNNGLPPSANGFKSNEGEAVWLYRQAVPVFTRPVLRTRSNTYAVGKHV